MKLGNHMIQVHADGLVFRVAVDGREVAARLLGPTLQRLFGAQPAEPRSWLHAYRAHAAHINRAAIQKGRRQHGQSDITLHDEDFAALA